MGARRKGRELAAQALYQIELSGESSEAALRLFFGNCDAGSRAKEFAAALVAGVHERQERLDQLIAEASEHWRFERLSRVDLSVLRVAAYELLVTPELPINVVIDAALRHGGIGGVRQRHPRSHRTPTGNEGGGRRTECT
jgi:N utilization substance protein B